LLRGTDGIRRRRLPARVEREEAVESARRWLEERPDRARDRGRAALVGARLLYLPIWEVKAEVVGWEFGRRRRDQTVLVSDAGGAESLKRETVEQPVAEPYLQERRLYREATDLAALGWGRPQITGTELALPYLPGEVEPGAAVLEHDQGLAALRQEARRSFVRPADGTLAQDLHLFVLRERAGLLYYPVWSLRYRHGDRLYPVTVDARHGVVHSARYPVDNRARRRRLVLAYAALAGILTLLLWSRSLAPLAAEAALWGVAVVGAVALWIALRFELAREKEYRETFSA